MKRNYALEKGGPKTLEISWGLGWKDFTVRQDGDVIGTVATQKELKEGREFSLKDGSRLYVRLSIGLMNSGLEVLRDGKPVEGSDSDPSSKVNGCFGLMLFVAVLNIIGGLALLFIMPDDMIARADALLFGTIYLFFGFVYVLLGLMIKKVSLIALYISITLLVLEMLMGVGLMAMAGSTGSVFWIIIRIFIVIYLVTSVKYFKELRETQA